MTDPVLPAGGALNEGLRQMAEVLVATNTLEAVLGLVVSIGQTALPPIDAVSISVITVHGFGTWASTCKTARALDEIQYAAGRGPCVEAARTGSVVDAMLHELGDDWSELVEPALREQFRRVCSVPLIDDTKSLGALNLYASDEKPFDARDEQLAQVLAWHAAVAIANADADAFERSGKNRIDNDLRSALLVRERIAEAKGILMARGGISSEEAFDMLRRASQRSNRKVRDIAQELIDSRTGKGLEEGEPS